MTDNFKEIGSLFGREGAGAGFAMEFQTIPSTMSSMMTMTISQPFQSQKPSKLERKETI